MKSIALKHLHLSNESIASENHHIGHGMTRILDPGRPIHGPCVGKEKSSIQVSPSKHSWQDYPVSNYLYAGLDLSYHVCQL